MSREPAPWSAACSNERDDMAQGLRRIGKRGAVLHERQSRPGDDQADAQRRGGRLLIAATAAPPASSKRIQTSSASTVWNSAREEGVDRQSGQGRREGRQSRPRPGAQALVERTDAAAPGPRSLSASHGPAGPCGRPTRRLRRRDGISSIFRGRPGRSPRPRHRRRRPARSADPARNGGSCEDGLVSVRFTRRGLSTYGLYCLQVQGQCPGTPIPLEIRQETF